MSLMWPRCIYEWVCFPQFGCVYSQWSTWGKKVNLQQKSWKRTKGNFSNTLRSNWISSNRRLDISTWCHNFPSELKHRAVFFNHSLNLSQHSFSALIHIPFFRISILSVISTSTVQLNKKSFGKVGNTILKMGKNLTSIFLKFLC